MVQQQSQMKADNKKNQDDFFGREYENGIILAIYAKEHRCHSQKRISF